ncbi:MAG: 30S ribosomal protein S6 [Candidatus Adiutrix intracellularis]|jgi:small subunit ribosomal protein S6|nr:30S ribosomal protein S6 [Candidatus Adiutrix intracellularis]
MYSRRYETLILLAPNLEATKLETFKNKVEGIFSAGEGQIVRFEDWGRRRLAYPIKKELFGYYLLYDFQGRPKLATELERNLKIDETVFKYLTLVLSKNFTNNDLLKAKEKLLIEAAHREAEKIQREVAEGGNESENEVEGDIETKAETFDDEE